MVHSRIVYSKISISFLQNSTLKILHEFSKKNNLNLEQTSIKMLEQNLIKPKAKIGLNLFLNSLNLEKRLFLRE